MTDWRQLYDHKIRCAPDHVISGEISTENARAFLAILNVGVTGVRCTIHAESSDLDFDQIWNGAGAGEPEGKP